MGNDFQQVVSDSKPSGTVPRRLSGGFVTAIDFGNVNEEDEI
jgi:hypothetical protein